MGFLKLNAYNLTLITYNLQLKTYSLKLNPKTFLFRKNEKRLQ
jgi:hypothetical protein